MYIITVPEAGVAGDVCCSLKSVYSGLISAIFIHSLSTYGDKTAILRPLIGAYRPVSLLRYLKKRLLKR